MGARYPNLTRRRKAECGKGGRDFHPSQNFVRLRFRQVVHQPETQKQSITPEGALPCPLRFSKSVIEKDAPVPDWSLDRDSVNVAPFRKVTDRPCANGEHDYEIGLMLRTIEEGIDVVAVRIAGASASKLRNRFIRSGRASSRKRVPIER